MWKGQSLNLTHSHIHLIIFIKKDYKKESKCCDFAIQLNPKNDMAFNNKALSNLKKYQEATECYDKTIQLNQMLMLITTRVHYSFYLLAIALHQMKKIQQAIKFYDKALQVKVFTSFNQKFQRNLYLLLETNLKLKLVFLKLLMIKIIQRDNYQFYENHFIIYIIISYQYVLIPFFLILIYLLNKRNSQLYYYFNSTFLFQENEIQNFQFLSEYTI
ncbi:unnamed protein product [Paramecium pentaurelia]|uniref:Tetratricopeptide repeat protein n=1 Tax=Paramecium pentaurelia TaxID=43138 RepID=A0A8S1SDZ0_9CILI|nr:unnamed protein product [Paramecium pentaurelia]CAD8138158.1 unnamed protein product [Paramecium pentaurelia]